MMSPSNVQTQILSKNSKNAAQNHLYAKRRASATPMCEVETCENFLVPKKIDVIRVSFENVTAQIAPSLLSNQDSLHTVMLKINQPRQHLAIIRTNLQGKRQHGGFMAEVKGNLAKNATSAGVDPTELGRLKYADEENSGKRLKFLSAHQSANRNQLLEHHIVNLDSNFSQRLQPLN